MNLSLALAFILKLPSSVETLFMMLSVLDFISLRSSRITIHSGDSRGLMLRLNFPPLSGSVNIMSDQLSCWGEFLPDNATSHLAPRVIKSGL